MSIELPLDVQPIIQQAIASGRGADEVDVVRQALRLYAQVEQRRQSLRREIVKGIESGDSISGEVVFQELEQLANQLAECAGEPER
jgi:putative addiction module CopG family antidote